MITKTCSRCEQSKASSDFYADKRASDGLRSECKSCLLAAQKQHRDANRKVIRQRDAIYRANESKESRRAKTNNWAKKNRKKVSANIAQWRRKNPKATIAHRFVARMIRKGELVRPDDCERCGDASVKIEASHDDYNRPEVIEWLCPRCHRIKDKNPIMEGAITAEKRI